jgi:rod shape determining protein RodA
MSVLHRSPTRASRGFSLGRYLANLDWILMGATAGLVAFGLAMIYSATYGDSNIDDSSYYLWGQAVGLTLGAVAMIVLSLVDFTYFAGLRRFLYWGTVAVLVLTLIIGSERMGARRWIALPFFDVQTSEIGKVFIILALAGLLAEGVELRGSLRFVVKAIAYVALPAGLVFLQPDLGTALVLVAVVMAMMLVWGIRWSHLALLTGAGLMAVTMVLRVLPRSFGIEVLKPYQVERLTVFLNPEHDTSGAAYQLVQSKIAVASGMFSGKGYMEGTQTNLNFLPAHHTDFIFSVIGEELGFIGSLVLLGLFLVIVWRAFRIASMSKSLFGTLIVAGIVGMIVFQVFVNIGMTLGIMPITGIPLPFVSFGSNSLMIFLISIGILQSVHVHSRTALYGGRLKGDSYGQMAT